MMSRRVALVTGGARRIGAAIIEALHGRDCDVVIHYRNSDDAARELAERLNGRRADSACCLQADLQEPGAAEALAESAVNWQGRVDVLVNSASSFYPTPVGGVQADQWDDLLGSNLRAPFFLAQALAPALRAQGGAIINLVDIFAQRPMPRHPVYSAAKAGLAMLTKSLALELAPEVRVNGVAPGAILWPEHEMDEAAMQATLARVPLGRTGEPSDIAGAVCFLALAAPYVTGQVLAVDGGRSLGM